MRSRRVSLAFLAACLTALALWLAWRWQPERAALRRFEALCEAAGDRKAGALERLIDPSYQDRWGMDRATAVREARQMFGQFFALQVEPLDTTVEPGPGAGELQIRARIRLTGTGTALAELAKTEANRLETPWVFTWRRADWRPWKWQLTRLDNPGIDLSRRIDAW